MSNGILNVVKIDELPTDDNPSPDDALETSEGKKVTIGELKEQLGVDDLRPLLDAAVDRIQELETLLESPNPLPQYLDENETINGGVF